MPEEKFDNPLDIFNKFKKEYEKVLDEINVKKLKYVPYEIFRQAMEWNTENMKHLYDLMHQLATEQAFRIEFSIGEISFVFTGRHQDSDKIIESAERMVASITKKLLDKERTELISKSTKRNTDDKEKIYS